MKPAPDEDGDCCVCGCTFEDPFELTHECPPGFLVAGADILPLELAAPAALAAVAIRCTRAT